MAISFKAPSALRSCGPATEPGNPRIPKIRKKYKIPHPGLPPLRAAKRGCFKRGGFPIWTCPSFFVLFCPFLSFWDFPGDFPDLRGDGPGIFPIGPFPLSQPIKSQSSIRGGGVQGGVWAKMFNTGSQFQYILTGLSATLVAGVFQCCTCPCVSRLYFSVL